MRLNFATWSIFTTSGLVALACGGGSNSDGTSTNATDASSTAVATGSMDDATNDPRDDLPSDATDGSTSSATSSLGTSAAGETTASTDPTGETTAATQPRPSFFVTSVGIGNGGDLGGLAGADAHCQSLADAAGWGTEIWRAYLSASAEDARDRIGTGPWWNLDNAPIASDVDDLLANGIDAAIALTDTGELVPLGEHDLLTGSTPEGRLNTGRDGVGMTCSDWTSSAPAASDCNGAAADSANCAAVGHSDEMGAGAWPDHWSSAHHTPCDPAGMAGLWGSGRFYCFAQ